MKLIAATFVSLSLSASSPAQAQQPSTPASSRSARPTSAMSHIAIVKHLDGRSTDAGWPSAMTAVSVAKEVLQDK